MVIGKQRFDQPNLEEEEQRCISHDVPKITNVRVVDDFIEILFLLNIDQMKQEELGLQNHAKMVLSHEQSEQIIL